MLETVEIHILQLSKSFPHVTNKQKNLNLPILKLKSYMIKKKKKKTLSHKKTNYNIEQKPCFLFNKIVNIYKFLKNISHMDSCLIGSAAFCFI